MHMHDIAMECDAKLPLRNFAVHERMPSTVLFALLHTKVPMDKMLNTQLQRRHKCM